MNFLSLGTKQKERSKTIALLMLARGERWFLMRAPWFGGFVFWLGMNAWFLTRDHAGMRGRVLFGWEAAFLILSMLFGFVDSLILWKRIKRLAGSE